jgi:hypothetical protein
VTPVSGMLFANDHDADRTFIFDVRDPLHPKTVTSFTVRGLYWCGSAEVEGVALGLGNSALPSRPNTNN